MNDADEITLKECPFCMESADIETGIAHGFGYGYTYLRCENCGAEIRARTEREAAEAWNRRAESFGGKANE